jgi:Tfp pilus assembly protein PilP
MRALLIVFCFGVLLGAQAPAPGQPAAPAQPPASPDAPPAPPPNFTYSPEGRRDPFINLLNRGTTDPRQGAAGKARPEGVAGLTVDEVAVRGIVFSRGAWVAMVGAPNGRTYSIRAGDKLMDGSVRAINATTVILMQEVNDPLSLEKQREVRKYLRGEVK